MKKRLLNMFTLTGIILVVISAQEVFGQDVTVTLDKTCYGGTGGSMTITASYGGSFIINGVIWSYSGRHKQDTIVQTSCSVFQSDTGFPNSRITYVCPPNTTNSNTYQLILSNLVAEDLNTNTWSTTFQVSGPSNPNFQTVLPKVCVVEKTTPSDTERNVIIVCVVSLVLIILAGLYCYYRKKMEEKAIWYEVIPNFVTGNWSLGASVGAFCITKVTPGGHADGKLKVGYQIQRINGEPLSGKDQKEVKAMLEDKTRLNLLVLLKGENQKTSFVKLNHKEQEQLGFEFVKDANMIKVSKVSQADLKLKAGDQILEINGVPVTGKDQTKIWAMINEKEKLTVDVLKVGRFLCPCLKTSSVELKREQLGFEYEYIAMVTNVTEGSKADGKLKKGDRILSINGKSTAGKSNADVNTLLKQAPEVLELSVRGIRNIKLNLKGKASSGIQIKMEEENIVVSGIEPESVAAISMKIKKGDHILSINGKNTAGKSNADVNTWLKPPPEVLDLSIRETRKVTLHKAPLGIKIKKEKKGIVVSAIEPQSAAAISGEVQIEDCILSISGISTVDKSKEEVMKQLENPSEVLELAIKRESEPERKITIKIQPCIQIKDEKENIVVSGIEPKLAAANSGEVEIGDCILSVNGVNTSHLKAAHFKKMLTFSIILKVTKDVTMLELDPDLNGSIGVKNALANTVISVKAKGPAALAGIQEEDEILKIDGKSTDSMTVKEISKIIASREKTVIFESARGEFTVERDTNGSLGLELSSTPNVVYKVDGNAALSRKVKPGDTIVSINGKKTKGKSHYEIRTMLKSSGDSISLKIKEAVTENGSQTSMDNRVSPQTDSDNSHRTSGQGARTNDIEMGKVSTEASSSGRLQTLETTGEKHDFRKPRLGNIS